MRLWDLPQAGLCEKKKRKKNRARKVGKAQRPPEVIPSDYNFFASLRELNIRRGGRQ